MSIKKKIGGAIMATALGAALIGGGSYALFTAEAVNSGNTFTTGGVTIEDVTGGPAIEATLYYANLAPGDSEEYTVTIKNTDTLDAWVKVSDYTKTGALFEGATPLVIPANTQEIYIPAGEERTFDFSYNFPLAADNTYQGAQGELTIHFQAVQAKNNTKSDNSGPINWN